MGFDASVKVVGIRLPDAEWRKIKAVWDSCEEAGIAVPEEVESYFYAIVMAGGGASAYVVPWNRLLGDLASGRE